MFILPNGQNIQFLPPSLFQQPATASGPPNEPAPKPSEANILQALKDAAPHLNRKQRRAKLAEIKMKAKSETSAAVKKEMAKQRKEASRG